jgi:hypothetical protein
MGRGGVARAEVGVARKGGGEGQGRSKKSRDAILLIFHLVKTIL